MMTSFPHELPWFLKDDSSNFVEVSYVTGWREDVTEGVSTASLDVPKATFDAMLERAAKHRGYFGHERDVFETVTRDAILHQWYRTSTEEQNAVSGSLGSLMNARVLSKQLVEARPFDGTPLLVRTYRKSAQPFSSFPCDAPVHSKRKVRRLELRIHNDARLVFSVQKTLSATFESTPSVRRVFLEIEKKKKLPSDLHRTIENTIQVVMMGMAPQGKGLSLLHVE